jgi:D-tyrosyl-tRNA(Tyr) deacylase
MPPRRPKKPVNSESFVEQIRAAGLTCHTGRFQETMQVESVNEGPVTILLDSTKLF